MKTLDTIQAELAAAGKPVQRRQLFRYLQWAKVRPINNVTRPRLYPMETTRAVLTFLGLARVNGWDKRGAAVLTVTEIKRQAKGRTA